MPRRVYVPVRLSPDGVAAIDKLATHAGVTRSEMIRRLLAEAITHPQHAPRTTQHV